jgi:hypothetical protein
MIKPVRKYSLTKVRELRANRKLLKTNGSSQIFQTDAEYQSFLGELKGAGHLQITGFNKMNVTIDSNHWSNKSEDPRVTRSKELSEKHDFGMDFRESEVFKKFQKQRREIFEKYYLKSLYNNI